MFEEHFGFRRTPFVRETPAEALYRSRAHKEALARLRYVAENRLFMALTGESGVGKSTTLRALKHELDVARFDVIYIGLTNPSTVRSEEHTSELQSRPHLVCRLLLEKK